VNGRSGVHRASPNVFALGSCALALMSLSGCGPDTRDANRSADNLRDPGYSATDTEIIQTDLDGQPRYRLHAARIEQNPVSLETRIEDLRLETRTGEANSWRVVSSRGTLSRDSRRIDLEGGVALEGGASEALAPLRLQTNALQYDLDAARVRTSGEVRLTMEGHELYATGLDANLRTRQVQLKSDVQGRFAR